MDDHRLWRFEHILCLVPFGIAQFDSQQRCLFANGQFASTFGLAGDHSIGRPLTELIGAEGYQALRPSLAGVLAGAASQGRLLRNGDGALNQCWLYVMPETPLDDGHVPGFLLVTSHDTSRVESDDDRGDREQVLRETLVREVHHRLKNSLQGVIGLLRLHATTRPELTVAVDEAVDRLQASAIVFGISARPNRGGVALCDMVSEMSRNVGHISGVNLEPVCDESILCEPVILAPAYTTSVGLVANELLSNAIKHSSSGQVASVGIRLERQGEVAHLRILSRNASLPSGFDFAAGKGLKNGLGLVKLLLPEEGCRLVIEHGSQGVLADLALWPPVVTVR